MPLVPNSAATSEHKKRLEQAARRLFRERGFHGTSLRDIAKLAQVSLGNIYNHFDGKEQLFEALLETLYLSYCRDLEPIVTLVAQSELLDALEVFGTKMQCLIREHHDYVCFVYIDIVEFGGRHARAHYEDLAKRFDAVIGEPFVRQQQRGQFADWIEPGAVFALLYMQYSSYFVVEHLIGARRHLGMNDSDAVSAIAKLFRFGVEPR